jgi:hypothetical protein
VNNAVTPELAAIMAVPIIDLRGGGICRWGRILTFNFAEKPALAGLRMEGSRLRLPEASQTPQGAASSAPPTLVIEGTFFSRINIPIQFSDYLFDLVLKLPINVQASHRSRYPRPVQGDRLRLATTYE